MSSRYDKQNAKKKQSTAKRKFNRIYSRIKELEQDKRNSYALLEGFQDLEMAYTDLEFRYDTYLNTLDSENEEENTQLEVVNDDMGKIYNKFCEVRMMANRIDRKKRQHVESKVERKPSKDKEKVCKENTKQFRKELKSVERKGRRSKEEVKLFKGKAKQLKENASPITEELLEEGEKTFTKEGKFMEEIKQFKEEENTLIKEVNPYKEELNPYKEEVNPYKEEVNPYKEEVNPFKEVVNPYREVVNPYKEEAKPFNKKEIIEVKESDAPIFSGDIREYRNFKRECLHHINQTHDKESFILKKHLAGEALELVQGFDSNYQEIFMRLDTMYGKPEKLANLVLNYLKQLRSINGDDDNKFIAMVDVVERCWLDLKQMDMQDEMSTSTMVSQIETLLSPIQKENWILQKQNMISKEFKDFLTFLLEEKQAMEHMQDSRQKIEINNEPRIVLNPEETNNDLIDEGGLVDAVTNQVKENQQALGEVVKGLTRFVQAMSGKEKHRDNDESIEPVRNKNCWHHNEGCHNSQDCTCFAPMDNKNVIEKSGKCYQKTGHIAGRWLQLVTHKDNQKCGRFRHPIAHSPGKRKKILLMLSEIISRGIPIVTLWDPGTNMSLVTHQACRKLGLVGKRITLSITKIGNITESISNKDYLLLLTDKIAKCCKIPVFGIKDVTAYGDDIDFNKISRGPFHIPKGGVKKFMGMLDNPRILLRGLYFCDFVLYDLLNGVDQVLTNSYDDA